VAPSRAIPVGLLVLVLPTFAVVIFALLGPLIAPHPLGQPVGRPYAGPGPGLPFGTDHLGRDVWSQVLYGGRRLVLLPLAATVAVAIVGGAIGLLSGYVRNRLTRGIGGLLDLLLALPAILVLLVLVNGWGASATVLVVVFLLVGVPYSARYARAATLRVVTGGFVDHAVAMGERPVSVVWREILPNVAGPLLADGGLRLIGGIYLVATASFLGFGASPPATDWAQMISENIAGGSLNPWSVVLPTLLIAALAIAVNLLADRFERWIAG
jgi:ABC-type dipeptide/oligopeptide/nickel transport system permease subunit